MTLKTELTKLGRLKRAKDKADAAAAAATKDYEAQRTAVLGLLNSEDLDTARHGDVMAQREKRTIAVVDDREKYFAYMHRYKAYDLLQFRPALGAIRDRIADGKRVPARLETVRTLKVTLTK